MTAFDLDPVFTRALKLMHSKSRDSAEQLRLLLEEVTKQKYGGSSRLLPAMKRLGEEKFDCSKSGGVEVSAKSSSSKSVVNVQQTTLHQVPSSVSSPVSPHSKNDEISVSSDTLGSSRVIGGRHGSDGSDSDDVDDLALEILEEDLMCVVCRGMDVGARNRLVECVECHSLYHQECHRPPILEAHASDPRRVWTCSACAKPPYHQQPAAAKQSTSVRVGGGKPISCITSKKTELKSSSSSSSGGVSAQQVSSKSGVSGNSSKAAYSSSSSSSSSTKSTSSSGLAKAASSSKNADLSLSSKPSVISSSSSGVSSGVSGSSSSSSTSNSSSSSTSKASSSKIAHADKRIQIMKKKAAKLQEKRKLSK